MNLRPVGIALSLGLTLACAHRQLDTSISGHHAENLRAEAQKVEGGWRVTLQLPIGEWQVKTPNEEQRIQVIQVRLTALPNGLWNLIAGLRIGLWIF